MFNKSLTSGIFPDQMKIVKSIPMYKSEDRYSINNYRPISILPFFSKMFDASLMCNRLLYYVNTNNILFPNQFGFREKHSTYVALLKLIDDILKEIDTKNYVVSINCTDSSFYQLPVVSLKAPIWTPFCSSCILTILLTHLT